MTREVARLADDVPGDLILGTSTTQRPLLPEDLITRHGTLDYVLASE